MSGERCGRGFEFVVVDEADGKFTAQVTGDWAAEAGGHRWQRVPPTEKRGRVHTSTVTVAVVSGSVSGFRLDPTEVVETVTRGSGAGGQHRNTTDSAVRVRHEPTGTTVMIADSRSQHANRAKAWAVLEERLRALHASGSAVAANAMRREQVGSGERGDKIRTYRMQDDAVTDHRTGRKSPLRRWLNGDWQ